MRSASRRGSVHNIYGMQTCCVMAALSEGLCVHAESKEAERAQRQAAVRQCKGGQQLAIVLNSRKEEHLWPLSGLCLTYCLGPNWAAA